MTRSEWRVEKTEATGTRGMVVADDERAAEAGAAMLRRGGNAIDAAVAAAFVMGVVEPLTSGPGGVAAMVLHQAGKTVVIDGSGVAPRGAAPDMFELLPSGSAGMYGWPATRGNEHNEGARSIGVPGMVACVLQAQERYGALDRATVLAPAIAEAERGAPVPWRLAASLGNYVERLSRHPEAARIFLRPSGAPLRTQMAVEPGDDFAQPDLARTLRRIAEAGADDFYRGELARVVVDEVRRLGGVLDAQDLAAYRARELAPLVATYRDVELRTLPEASGATTLVEALNLLEGFALRGHPADGARTLHLLAESSRVAFLDRFAYLTRDDSASVARLVSKEFAERRRRDLDPARARTDATAAPPDQPHTTHVSVVDASGTAVSLTSTLGQGFGSGVVPRGTGMLLSDVMTWFDPRPGRANSIAPGKRILWAIAPTIALRDGAPWLVVGAPGARRLITSVLQALVRSIDFDLGPQAAVNGVRVHCEGARTLLDARAAPAVRDELARLGHRLEIVEETFASAYFGRANAIRVDRDGTLRGGVHRLKATAAVGV